jgi:hypothetical protein
MYIEEGPVVLVFNWVPVAQSVSFWVRSYTTNQSIHPVGRIQFQEKFEDTIELIRSCISTMQWLKERE